jgi:phenol 2-monooxygenase
MLTLLLSRYGIGDDRLLCVDSKDGSTVAGQADGLQPRTLEVFKGLGIADEILREACQMWEVAFWNPSPDGIGRTNIVPNIGVPARYPQEFTVHQGRIERILKNDLARYSARGVRYNTCVDSVRLDPEFDAIYPVELTIKTTSRDTGLSYSKIRAKHIVGCDGAHSIVRKAFGLELQGDTRDHIWGVVDLVVDTDFPDIRRRCAIHSDSGSVMVIPRERIPSGDYLTRLYIQVDDGADERRPDSGFDGTPCSEQELDAREQARQKRAQITLQDLLQRAQAALRPYKLAAKQGTEVDWWAAYQIGQRMADKFCVRDDGAIPRVLIAGDGEFATKLARGSV